MTLFKELKVNMVELRNPGQKREEEEHTGRERPSFFHFTIRLFS
jgi:hypothetical protein